MDAGVLWHSWNPKGDLHQRHRPLSSECPVVYGPFCRDTGNSLNFPQDRGLAENSLPSWGRVADVLFRQRFKCTATRFPPGVFVVDQSLVCGSQGSIPKWASNTTHRCQGIHNSDCFWVVLGKPIGRAHVAKRRTSTRSKAGSSRSARRSYWRPLPNGLCLICVNKVLYQAGDWLWRRPLSWLQRGTSQAVRYRNVSRELDQANRRNPFLCPSRGYSLVSHTHTHHEIAPANQF